LVEQVELGDLNSDKTRALVAQYVLPLITQNVDFIVLGCTHYPFLASLIQELVGSSITVIDSGSAIARELKSRLEKAEILADRNYSGSVQFWSSDETGKAKQVISQLWGDDVDLSSLPTCVPV
jgi:glutamate racemase